MRRTPVFERVRVVPEALTQRIQRRVILAHSIAQLLVVVNTLGAGHDFLAAHEEVVGVRELGVGGVGGGVERSDGGREFVDGVEICVVFFEDYFTQGFFVGGTAENVRCVNKRV